jgi:hypothetical protein
MRVRRSIDLPCGAEEAWAVLTDWERQADWMLDADAVEVTSEAREGIGVTLAVRTRLLQVPAFTDTIEVVAWEPPTELVIAHGPPIRGRGIWAFVEHDGPRRSRGPRRSSSQGPRSVGSSPRATRRSSAC